MGALRRMQPLVLAFSYLSTRFLVHGEETCGKWEAGMDPRLPVHFSPTHGGQWRLLATEGQKQDGTIIKGIKGESSYPTVIRGHWAIGELEFYADPNCEGPKHLSYPGDDAVLSPLHTTYGWQDDPLPAEHPFHASLGEESPWYSEIRAIDGCSTSEFWSQCYQCDASSAWYGVKFDDADLNGTQIKCVKMYQKDADAYTATRVELHRWYPNTTTCKTSEDDGAVTCEQWSWKKVGDWTGLTGGQWHVLRDNTTVAINSAHGSTGLGLVGVIGFLLWAMQ